MHKTQIMQELSDSELTAYPFVRTLCSPEPLSVDRSDEANCNMSGFVHQLHSLNTARLKT